MELNEFSLLIDPSIQGGQLSIRVYRQSDLAEEFEGFCAFGTRGMVGRDGNRYNETSDFLQSWRYS